MLHPVLRSCVIVCAVVAPLLFVSQAAVPTAAQSGVQVNMVNNLFMPATITVPAGTTVLWVNGEDPSGTDVDHDVESGDATNWGSDLIHPGQSFSYTFTSPGTYLYFCDLHNNMEGTVIVQ